MNRSGRNRIARGTIKTARRLLIIEDDPDTLDVLEMTFKRLDIEVTCAPNGIDGLFEYYKALKERQPFRILIIDGALGGIDGIPAIDGFTVGENIRNVEKRAEAVPKAYHLYNTAFDEHVPGELLKVVEADGYFVKGNTPGELINKVVSLIDRENYVQ